VGRHTRLPRLYRNRDIFYWLDRIGLMTQPLAAMRDPVAAMRQPSLQLAGRPDRRNMDLAVLQGLGVRLLGRLCAIDGDRAEFASSLAGSIQAADEKLARLLDDIDRHAGDVAAGARHRDTAPIVLPDDGGGATLSLVDAGIRSVIWATGYRRTYPWLDLPVLDPTGEIAHAGGVTALPGVYALGLRLLRRRNSNFIGSVGVDAQELADDVARYLGHAARRVA
jgi:putative flavoprotein involved in K+ transport